MREKIVDEKKSILLSRLRGAVWLVSLLSHPGMRTQWSPGSQIAYGYLWQNYGLLAIGEIPKNKHKFKNQIIKKHVLSIYIFWGPWKHMFFKYFYWLCYYTFPNFSPFVTLPPCPSILQHFPPLVHVHGLYT